MYALRVILVLSLLLQGEAALNCVAPPLAENVQRSLFNSRRLEGKGAPTDAQVTAAANVQRVKRVLTASQFEYLFPMANMGKGPQAGNGPYTYANLLKAVAKWPQFCNDAGPTGYTDATVMDNMCRKELATVFAQWSQEVGGHTSWWAVPEWRQALYYYEEMGCETGACTGYRGSTCDATTWQGARWPCPDGVSYFGRGAHQLSYNYNYGPFSEAVFDGDASVLLANPSLVVSADENGWLAFASAIWFYMTPQSPKPSGHDAAVGWWQPNQADIAAGRKAGFGVQIMIINGGVECGGATPMAQAANRVAYYQEFSKYFGIPAGDNLQCTNMQQFDTASSASAPAYWERSWSSDSCQLVSYGTPWSVFDSADVNGPYCKCVSHYFGTV